MPMSPDEPLTPDEELEIRITAMLMGELSSDEAAALRAQMTARPELTAMHDRLSAAFSLLRAASRLADAVNESMPATLSHDRREQLFKRFRATHGAELKVVAP